MASYVYQDADNAVLLVEPGDWILEVVGYDLALSKSGDPQVELEVINLDAQTLERIPGKSGKTRETLTLNAKAGWRVDTFLRSCGLQIAKGTPVEFDPEERGKDPKAVFVDLRGLRGWGLIGHEPGQKDPNKKFNKVVTWYTNKPKVPRREHPPLREPGTSEMVDAQGNSIPF